MRVELVTTAKTTSTGVMMLAVDYDPSDMPPGSDITLLNNTTAVSGPVWQSQKIVVEPSRLRLKKFYCTPKTAATSSASVNQSVAANVHIASTDAVSSDVGSRIAYIYVDYCFRFSNYRPSPTVLGTLSLASNTTVDNAGGYFPMIQGYLEGLFDHQDGSTEVTTSASASPTKSEALLVQAGGALLSYIFGFGNRTSDEEIKSPAKKQVLTSPRDGTNFDPYAVRLQNGVWEYQETIGGPWLPFPEDSGEHPRTRVTGPMADGDVGIGFFALTPDGESKTTVYSKVWSPGISAFTAKDCVQITADVPLYIAPWPYTAASANVRDFLASSLWTISALQAPDQ